MLVSLMAAVIALTFGIWYLLRVTTVKLRFLVVLVFRVMVGLWLLCAWLMVRVNFCRTLLRLASAVVLMVLGLGNPRVVKLRVVFSGLYSGMLILDVVISLTLLRLGIEVVVIFSSVRVLVLRGTAMLCLLMVAVFIVLRSLVLLLYAFDLFRLIMM